MSAKKNSKKKPAARPSIKEKERAFEKRTSSIFNGGMCLVVTAFAIAQLTVFPLLTLNFYEAMGDIKSFSFYGIAALFLFLFVLILFFKAYGRKPEFSTFYLLRENKGPKISVWVPVLILVISEVLTLLFAYNRSFAMTGYPTWNVGFIMSILSILTFIVFFTAKSYGNGVPTGLWYLVAIGSVASFVIGILNVAGIAFPYADATGLGKISTFGNPNWYADYLSVTLPFLCAGLWLKLTKARRIVLHLSLFFGFVTAITSPSDSILLSLGAIFVLLFIFEVTLRKGKLWETGINLTVACLFSAFLKTLPGLQRNAVSKSLCLRIFTNPSVIITLGAISITGLIIYVYLKKKNKDQEHHLGKWLTFLPLIIVVVSLLVLIVQMNASFSEGIKNALSGRSKTWDIASNLFSSMPFGRKLVGCGQDSMGIYYTEFPDIINKMQETYNTTVLTNGHSSLVTILVNKGLIGLGAFLFFIYANMKAAISKLYIERTDENDISAVQAGTILVVLTVVSYLATSFVSFDNACNLPFLYMFMGL